MLRFALLYLTFPWRSLVICVMCFPQPHNCTVLQVEMVFNLYLYVVCCTVIFNIQYVTFSSSPLRILIFFSSSRCTYIYGVFTALMSSQTLFMVDCIWCLLVKAHELRITVYTLNAGPIGVWVSSTCKDQLIFSDFLPVLYPYITSLYLFDLLFMPLDRMMGCILFLSCLFVCLSVVNFNLCCDFWTLRDRDFISGMHTQLIMPFQMTSQ